MLKVMNICMQIVAYGSNGMVLVHYKGWKEKRREWIPRDRLTPIPTGDGQSSALVPGKLGRSHLSTEDSKKGGLEVGRKEKCTEEKEDTEEPIQ
jgi:hypothetical protein